MKKIIILITFLSFNSHAADILPGLWSTDNEVKIDGKILDIHKKIADAMAMIPEAQRAQFMKVMEQQMGSNGLLSGMMMKELCITKDMVKDPLSFMNKQKDCKSTPIKNENKLKVFNIKCENGSNGVLTWNIANNKNYSGKFDGVSHKKEKVLITFSGKHKASKCK